MIGVNADGLGAAREGGTGGCPLSPRCEGRALRSVSPKSSEWLRGGVGGLDVYPLAAAGPRGEPPTPADPNGVTRLKLWANKVSMRRVQDLKQNSPEWLQWRRKGVGGSEAGAVYGVSPYDSPRQVYDRKVGVAEESGENADMARGRELEPKARAIYESLFGWTATPLCVLHDEHDFIRVSLDGLRDDGKVVLEVKCPRPRAHGAVVQYGEIKPWYYAQVQYQLLVTAADVCHFVSYCPAWTGAKTEQFAVLEVLPDLAYQADLQAAVVDFWGHVERQVPPDGA